LRDAAVVGVTITGAAKYNELLKTMNSQMDSATPEEKERRLYSL